MEGPWTPAGGILGEGVAQGATKFNKLARTMDDHYHDFKTRIFQQVNEASIIHRACKLVSPRTSRLVSVVSTDTFGRVIGAERINVAINYDKFDIFGRGIDVERINVAINYDMPDKADSYLHRVGRAGRFGTKGLSISFISSPEDEAVLKSIEERFEVSLPEFPEKGVDASTYMDN